MNRKEVERYLIEMANSDESFRKALKSDPDGTIRKTLSHIDIPPNLKIKVVEETPDEVYLVLPPKTK